MSKARIGDAKNDGTRMSGTSKDQDPEFSAGGTHGESPISDDEGRPELAAEADDGAGGIVPEHAQGGHLVTDTEPEQTAGLTQATVEAATGPSDEASAARGGGISGASPRESSDSAGVKVANLEDLQAVEEVDILQRLGGEAQSAERQLHHAELVVKAKRDRYEDLSRQVDQARINRDALINARDSLDAWLSERERSLSIQLLHHVDAELARVAADEARMRTFGELRDFTGLSRKLRRAFVISMWAALGTAAIVTVMLFIIAVILHQFEMTMPLLELSPWRYLVLFAILLLLGTIRALLPYHRGFVGMRRELNQQLAWGRHALASIDRIRQDQSRLGELRPQLEERLEFYGSVLQESWRIPESPAGTAAEGALAESLPSNLQVATVTETSEETWNRLLQRFTAQQFKVGLRREAADWLLAEAASRHGLDAARVDFAFVDRDNLQRDLRQVLMKYAESPAVLERLGRERTIQIAEAIQRALSPQDDNRPEISITNVGDLDGLVIGNDLLAEWRHVRNSWDEFMSDILEDPSALSLLAFSSLGQADGQHHRFDSVAVAPERVRSRASQHVTWMDIRSDAVTGTEVATRIDVTEPVDVRKVALFAEQGEVLGESLSQQTSVL